MPPRSARSQSIPATPIASRPARIPTSAAQAAWRCSRPIRATASPPRSNRRAPGRGAPRHLPGSGRELPARPITTGGNPDLRNEISETLTFGIVLQPRFIPGLTIVADRIEVDLQDGLSAFTTRISPRPATTMRRRRPSVCNAFTRQAQPNAPAIRAGRSSPAGPRPSTPASSASAARSTTSTISSRYRIGSVPMPGRLELSLEATHTSLLTSSVTGTTFNRTDNTVAQPDWVVRFDARYQNGPARFTYQIVYLDEVKANGTATIENNPNPILDANWTHNSSMQYDFGQLELRARRDQYLRHGAVLSEHQLWRHLGAAVSIVGARVRF